MLASWKNAEDRLFPEYGVPSEPGEDVDALEGQGQS